MNPLLETLIMAGLVSREDAQRMVWLLDPEAARAYAEQVLTVAVQNGLTGQQLRLVDMLRANGFRIDDAAVDAFWRAEEQRLIAEWVPEFQRVASEQAIAALAQADGMAMWQAVDRAVIDWVEDYYISFDTNRVGSIPNINEQSRTLIGNLFNQWQRGELDDAPTSEEGLPRLIAAMEEAFGTVRGERIAVTESTRIYSMSNVEAARANEFITTLVSLSAADELLGVFQRDLRGFARFGRAANQVLASLQGKDRRLPLEKDHHFPSRLGHQLRQGNFTGQGAGLSAAFGGRWRHIG